MYLARFARGSRSEHAVQVCAQEVTRKAEAETQVQASRPVTNLIAIPNMAAWRHRHQTLRQKLTVLLSCHQVAHSFLPFITIATETHGRHVTAAAKLSEADL